MDAITFNELPNAVSEIFHKLENIERLLSSKDNNQQSESDELLTIKQAAKFISLSVPTIYGLVSRSEIPLCKKGKRLYFSKYELQEWIKTGRKKTNSEIKAEAEKFIINKNR